MHRLCASAGLLCHFAPIHLNTNLVYGVWTITRADATMYNQINTCSNKLGTFAYDAEGRIGRVLSESEQEIYSRGFAVQKIKMRTGGLVLDSSAPAVLRTFQLKPNNFLTNVRSLFTSLSQSAHHSPRIKRHT